MLGGCMVWIGMSRGRFVGGRNVKAPLKREKLESHLLSYQRVTEEKISCPIWFTTLAVNPAATWISETREGTT
jgi:hypothetical protein